MNPKNTVSAEHQTGDKGVFGLNEKAHPRILFVGNSITLHHPAPQIGWTRKCGMAATDEAHDYVHLVMDAVKEKYPEADFTIAAQANWERAFWTKDETLLPTRAAAEWKPDAVVIRIGENTPIEALENGSYADALVYMAKFYGGDTARYVVTDEFWKCKAKDVQLAEAAERLGAEFVIISNLGQDITNTADGLFEHGGVACHPGDKGMRLIADRILEKLLPLLEKIG